MMCPICNGKGHFTEMWVDPKGRRHLCQTLCLFCYKERNEENTQPGLNCRRIAGIGNVHIHGRASKLSDTDECTELNNSIGNIYEE